MFELKTKEKGIASHKNVEDLYRFLFAEIRDLRFPSFYISLHVFSLQELESIAAKRVVESLASRSELGQIRTRLQDLEDSRNKWMKKAQARGKMLQDLCTVVKRYIQDVEAEKVGAKPIIITRSVGLQVVDAAAAKKVSLQFLKKGCYTQCQ